MLRVDRIFLRGLGWGLQVWVDGIGLMVQGWDTLVRFSFRISGVQGYLALKQQRPPRTLQ